MNDQYCDLIEMNEENLMIPQVLHQLIKLRRPLWTPLTSVKFQLKTFLKSLQKKKKCHWSDRRWHVIISVQLKWLQRSFAGELQWGKWYSENDIEKSYSDCDVKNSSQLHHICHEIEEMLLLKRSFFKMKLLKKCTFFGWSLNFVKP